MLIKLFFLSILIINFSFKYNCKECFDFQCFDGGKKMNPNCFQCTNVSVHSQNQWLKHIDQMISIYKALKRYESVTNLEFKKNGGMYCCSIDSKNEFNTCSLTFNSGAKNGIPHYGFGCSSYDIWFQPKCKSNVLGNRCCQNDHCNVPNVTELQYMKNKTILYNPLLTTRGREGGYVNLIIIFTSLICIGILVVLLFCYVKFYKTEYQRSPTTNHSQNKPFYKKLHCLMKFFTIIRDYKRRKNLIVIEEYGDSRKDRNHLPLSKMDSLDYLSCSGSGAGKPLMTKRTAATEISLIRAVGEGRFGTVWLGKWNGDDVAVKIFSTRDERSWDREKQIYQRNFLRHSNVLGYVATDSRDNGMATELWLVTDYHENGSLYDYLRSHVLSGEQAVKMARSITNGLAHLHMEINGTELRPGIAHRDLKSRNILVKSCGECCIGDLGLAVRLNEDFSVLDSNRVGTRRYMAPEVILDKIVLSDLQYNGGLEAFKKADIYSYSLVLWEILRCCECSSMNIASFPYEMPYQSCVSNDPSIEEMRDIVCEKKLRPSINQSWNNLNPLKDISKCIQESWFDEPASRLSIMRLKKIMANAWTEVSVLKLTVSDLSFTTNHVNGTSNLAPISKYPPPASNLTLSTDFSPLSITSSDIPNIVIKSKNNVLITDPYSLVSDLSSGQTTSTS